MWVIQSNLGTYECPEWGCHRGAVHKVQENNGALIQVTSPGQSKGIDGRHSPDGSQNRCLFITGQEMDGLDLVCTCTDFPVVESEWDWKSLC